MSRADREWQTFQDDMNADGIDEVEFHLSLPKKPKGKNFLVQELEDRLGNKCVSITRWSEAGKAVKSVYIEYKDGYDYHAQNFQLFEIPFSNGKADGIAKKYLRPDYRISDLSEGRLEESYKYKVGDCVCVRRYEEEGYLRSEAYSDGRYLHYNPDGSIDKEKSKDMQETEEPISDPMIPPVAQQFLENKTSSGFFSVLRTLRRIVSLGFWR